jgi:8-hydroxy-5-deazaflavin:NADPH oxidoreductase
MKIAILGAGNIGGNLGRRWAKGGHEIRFGVRKPDELRELVQECGAEASAHDPKSAAAPADVVVLALPWGAVAEVLASIGDATGKIVVDATNPLTWSDGPVHAVDTSGAEIVAGLLPGARVVKAFNTLGAEHILDPVVGGLPADVFVCTDDAGARETVCALAHEIGFRPLDLGPLRNARVGEHLAVAWIHLAMKAGLGRDIAFKVVGGA